MPVYTYSDAVQVKKDEHIGPGTKRIKALIENGALVNYYTSIHRPCHAMWPPHYLLCTFL